MITYHFNGEQWYRKDRSILNRILRWVIWFGGWEAHRRLHPGLLPRISLFGHRITFFGLGWWDVETPWGILTYSPVYGIYVSPDGTPDNARVWIKGTPKEVIAAAEGHTDPPTLHPDDFYGATH